MSDGRETVCSMIRCLDGSLVNSDGPTASSTIIRISWRYDKVAESPRYTRFYG